MNRPSQAVQKQRLVDSMAEQKLVGLTLDPAFNTGPSYTANTSQYPDHLIPFVDKHMGYLMQHPSVDVDHYVRNLRLSHRIRG